jgi:hypothetical protein
VRCWDVHSTALVHQVLTNLRTVSFCCDVNRAVAELIVVVDVYFRFREEGLYAEKVIVTGGFVNGRVGDDEKVLVVHVLQIFVVLNPLGDCSLIKPNFLELRCELIRLDGFLLKRLHSA